MSESHSILVRAGMSAVVRIAGVSMALPAGCNSPTRENLKFTDQAIGPPPFLVSQANLEQLHWV